MIVKGSKQTELGVIPEDWAFVNIGKSAILKARIGWQGLTTNEYLDVGDYGLITGTDFINGFIDWDNCVYVKKKRYVQDINIQVKVDDILVTKDGTIGKVAIINNVPQPTTLNSGVFVLRPIKKTFIPKYLYHILISAHFKEFLSRLTAGSTINHLYQKDFVHYSFPTPPTLKEQEAIAKVLTDTDNLIQALEKVIAKKKAIKKGAMQQLLTPPNKGGKRLPGFSGEWQTNKLKNISSFRRGSFPQPYGLDKWYDDISGMPFIQVVDVDKNKKLKPDTKRKISKEGAEYSVFVKKGTVVLTIQGSIGRICITQYDAYIDRTLLIFQTISDVFDVYMFMMLVDQKFEIEKEKAPGGIIKTITKEALSSFEINYPSTKEEQEAIATVLINMYKEIEALEVKKEKYIQLKKGLAQELLTGKTRLV